jgi:hypothetical protein
MGLGIVNKERAAAAHSFLSLSLLLPPHYFVFPIF